MIHIFDNYYIQVTDMCYTIMEKGKTQKGEVKYTPMGYYGRLETALQGLVLKTATKDMEGRELTLKQAIETIREYTRRVEAVVLDTPEGSE